MFVIYTLLANVFIHGKCIPNAFQMYFGKCIPNPLDYYNAENYLNQSF